jgi:preprotein translocase subunit SecD
MLQYSASKIALVLAVTLLGFVFASPNIMSTGFRDALPEWMKSALKPIQLGLDLQGGSYLLLEVDLDAVTKEQVINLEETVRATLREPRIGFRNLRAAEDGVFVSITDPEQFKQARELIVKAAVGLTVEALDEGRLHISIPDKIKKEREIAALSQSIEIVRRGH